MISYEWVVEEMDGEDIVDTNGFDTLPEAQRWGANCDMPFVICLRRDVGNDEDGLTDRQYAYPGATEFEAGARIPKRFIADLDNLPRN